MASRPGAMTLLAGLLGLYLVLDFANPLMPGAVCFDTGDSVEGAQATRDPADVAAPAAALPAVPAPLPDPRPRTASRRLPPRRRTVPRRPLRRPEPRPPRAADPH